MTAPRFDTDFARRVLAGRLLERRGPDAHFTRAVIDSRRAGPGDLFVGLPGDHVDGADFAADAVRRGVAGVLLGAMPDDASGIEGAALFAVDEPLAALQELGAAWRDALPATEVVGVTGNVGKTTTKLMAASVLARQFRVQASELNYNNEIGVPLCLLDLRPETERAVIEHGMYTTGEIALLCTWTQPRTGIVLNVGPVHLERAGSMDAIARAKRELVEALPADGHALLNIDDPVVAAMAGHTTTPVTRFGTAEDADVRGTDLEGLGAAGFAFTLHARGEQRRVRVPLPGAHLLSNVLAAAATGLVEDMSLDAVCQALEALDVPLRLTVRDIAGGVTLLDDTYNASPAATLAALDLLSEMPGRKLALLGDMLELGDLAESSHDEVGRRAAGVVDVLFTVGDLASRISDAARGCGLGAVEHLQSKDAAAAALVATLRPGDSLLVKGSRALALETVVAEVESQLEERTRGVDAAGEAGS
ncbi:MAG: UDP-N-acetylmuramoyl-tripeptide--D-alanyl-D-alanine ligase [Chloroflexi bacterium]|nr:UDP-N-acetylmuramoyl-tripeptide--D-alanyl-D-alanine ligase [Chloroflexota bacterium]